MRPRPSWRSALLAVAPIAFGAALYALRVPILGEAGQLLVVSSSPVPADVLVVMRGDETRFERTLTAADLFHAGYARRVYVSSALNDLPGTELQRRGVKVTSPQEAIASILLQRDVPCAGIWLDGSQPGGGTLGEARRLSAVMINRNLASALIVTSWFHTRRTGWIMDRALGRAGRKFTIVTAHSRTGPHNWWTFRYSAVTVLEEFFKLGAQATVGNLEFSDDPLSTPAYQDHIRSPAGCPQPA
jgi:uncharacterized SAM-binding protein YcdF (DUF218 family)